MKYRQHSRGPGNDQPRSLNYDARKNPDSLSDGPHKPNPDVQRKEEDEVDNVQAKLEGGGQSMGGTAKGNMECVFGADFSGVKLHTGSAGNEVAQSQNARAVTVGQDIAFASGEYAPGTMEGDALLAHELAHPEQQKDAAAVQKKEKGGGNESAYEQEADDVAVGAMGKIWGKTESWASKMGAKTRTGMKTGLKLQACNSTPNLYEKAEEMGITKADIDKRLKAKPAAPPQPDVYQGALQVAADQAQMDSFIEFQMNGTEPGKHSRFFFSNNPGFGVAASTLRPSSFPGRKNFNDGWNALTKQQQMTICDLTRTKAGTHVPDNKVSAKYYNELKTAYDAWPAGKYAVFISSAPEGGQHNNTCNIFVGESLYKSGHTLMKNNKYFSAAAIFAGADGKLVQIDKLHMAPGDIAAWGSHVAIVAKVNLMDNTFVTRDGYNLDNMGGENFNTREQREILSDNPKIFRLK